MMKIGAQIWNGSYPNCENYTIWTWDYIECFVRQAAFPAQHVCCTCPMGDRNDSVVDSRLKPVRTNSGSTHPTCPDHERWKWRGNSCSEKTCGFSVGNCTTASLSGSYFDKGYFRRKDEKCVTQDECGEE
ncbi:hypothetical protein HPB50_029391 [Hyalomma asiaticum]|nr:hypothetical protein HPB50_029391 [Hyalomma asiaticum]